MMGVPVPLRTTTRMVPLTSIDLPAVQIHMAQPYPCPGLALVSELHVELTFQFTFGKPGVTDQKLIE